MLIDFGLTAFPSNEERKMSDFRDLDRILKGPVKNNKIIGFVPLDTQAP